MKSLASNIYSKDKYIVPIMDAKAGRVYTGIYKWEQEELIAIKEQFPCNINELIDLLNEHEGDYIINGDGSENYRNILENDLKIMPAFSPKQFNSLKGSSLASLGYEMYIKDEIVSASEFAPKYLRLSQAERNKK